MWVVKVQGKWELSPCPVFPGGRELTAAEAALPWPNVVTDDDGVSFRALSSGEVKLRYLWSEVRKIRDRKLPEADRLVNKARDGETLGTHTQQDVVAAVAYRQALRDIPQTFGHPDDVIFPTPPQL